MSRTMVVIAGLNLYECEYVMEALPDQTFQRLVVARDEAEVKLIVPRATAIGLVQNDISMAIPTDYVPGYKKK